VKARWILAVVACSALLLAPRLGRAAEYHVSTIGNDGAAGSLSNPFRTVRRALDRAGPGDTVLIHAGTYAEHISTGDGPIRGGTSWSNALVIAAMPGETVVLQPPARSQRVVHLADRRASYIVLRGLALDARNVGSEAVKITWSSPDRSNTSHHVRIEDSEISGAPGHGVLVVVAHHNEFIRLRVHDNGSTDFDHGFYIAGPDNLIDGCDVYGNAGWGVSVYNGDAPDADRNVVRNNRLHHNARVRRRGAGLILSSGDGNLAYNNVVFANKVGIHVDYGATRSRVYNNTVFAQSEDGLVVGPGASDTDARNNLVFANQSDFTNRGVRTTLGTNLIGGNPRVADLPRFDVRLREDSAAVDAGATLADVPFDVDHVPRPQGRAYDVGAYEYARTTPPTLLPPVD